MAIKPIYPKNKKKVSVKRTGSSSRTAPRASGARYQRPASTVRKSKRPAKKSGFISAFTDLFHSERKAGEVDFTFLLLVCVLAFFGLIMLLSASTPTGDVKFHNSYYFFIRQLVFVVAGIAAMLIISRIDYRKLKPFAKPLMWICIVLLVLVFVPGIGIEDNGSRRWIRLGFRFQPSELAKLAVAMFYAAIIEDKLYPLDTLKGLSKYAVWIGVVAALMMAETHLSGTIVLLGIALCVILAGGGNAKIIIPTILGVGVFGGLLIYAIDPVRAARFISFLDPFADKQGAGYQTVQSLYAIGSGGIFGKGLGESVQKFSYLPEPHNDFIFSVICEETGFLGGVFIIALFVLLIWRGLKIASEATDKFASLTVIGIMSQVAIQTILNIGVATSSIPNTGVSLPFFSYGGTAVLMLLAEMGIVLSVSRYSNKNI